MRFAPCLYYFPDYNTSLIPWTPPFNYVILVDIEKEEPIMAVQASLGKNFIMNILLAASSLIFPLITYPYVSRILLPDGTGRVAPLWQ